MTDLIHNTIYGICFLVFQNSVYKAYGKSQDTTIPFQRESGFVSMYVDGLCINNGRKDARAGVGVWFNYKHAYNTYKPVTGKPTSVIADLEAAIVGLNICLEHDINDVMLRTDSIFTIKCMTRWISRWKENGWITTAGTPVKNREVIEELDELVNRMKTVHWVLVQGEDTEVGNIEATKLAKKAAKKYAINHGIDYDEELPPPPNTQQNYNKNPFQFSYFNKKTVEKELGKWDSNRNKFNNQQSTRPNFYFR